MVLTPNEGDDVRREVRLLAETADAFIAVGARDRVITARMLVPERYPVGMVNEILKAIEQQVKTAREFYGIGGTA